MHHRNTANLLCVTNANQMKKISNQWKTMQTFLTSCIFLISSWRVWYDLPASHLSEKMTNWQTYIKQNISKLKALREHKHPPSLTKANHLALLKARCNIGLVSNFNKSMSELLNSWYPNIVRHHNCRQVAQCSESELCASVTKWYNLIPAKCRWCSTAGKVATTDMHHRHRSIHLHAPWPPAADEHHVPML